MRHRVKKIKFKAGKDAREMLMKKLAVNFFLKGKLTTTIKKARFLKSLVEKLIEKTKEHNTANENYLLKHLNNKKLIKLLFENVGPVLKDKVGGYVRLIKIGYRASDGTELARLEWSSRVVIEPAPVKKIAKSEKITGKKQL